MLPALLRLAALFPRSVPCLLRVLAADADAHIKEPHWYLACVAVDSSHQGQGIGTGLLAPVLTRLDHVGELAFLVTSRERNLMWYGRLGFQVLEEVGQRSGPPFWPMLRVPAQGRRRHGGIRGVGLPNFRGLR